MRNTTEIGDLSAAMITAALLRARYAVLKPVSDGLRYDLVISRGDGFDRVQCKTAVLKRGAIVFRTYSVSGGGKRKMKYHGQVEFFGVYCPALDKCYLFPVSECSSDTPVFRVEPTKNKQQCRVKFAIDYEIKPM